MKVEFLKTIDRKHLLWFLIVMPLLSFLLFKVVEKYNSKKSSSEVTQLKNSKKLGTSDSDHKIFRLFKEQEAPRSVRPNEIILAQLADLSGEIRLKRAFSATWNRVFTAVDLYDGDQVFGGSRSSAKVVYTRDGSQISLSGYSLLRISQLPPLKTEYSRGSNVGDFAPPQGTAKFAYLMRNPGGQSAQAPKISDAEITEIRRRSRAKDKIAILNPSGNLMIFAKSFPAPLAIKLDRHWNSTKLWAYLWDQSLPGSAPAWTGASKGSFSKILIPKSGVYYFVVKSDDGRAESQIIEIAASQRIESEFPVLGFEQPTNKNLTVVYQ